MKRDSYAQPANMRAALRTLGHDEIDFAADRLGDPLAVGRTRSRAVHDARRTCKRMRALLRLAEGAKPAPLRRERQRLRDAGRRLALLRDRQAMAESFAQLASVYGKTIGVATCAAFRRSLDRRRKAAEANPAIIRKIHEAELILRGTAERAAGWPVGRCNENALCHGLMRSARRARKAMKRAKKHPAPENDHEWRKRAGDHWNQMRLLRDLGVDMGGLGESDEKRLRKLKTCLGDLQNIRMLRAYVMVDPGAFAKPAGIRAFLKAAKRHEEKLREKAFAQGKKLYGRKK